MWPTFFYLGLTVVFEAFGTACIQASQQFTRLRPSAGVVLGYGLAFWFLSLSLKSLPLGIVYAAWPGLGIILATTAGWMIFGQRVEPSAVAGMGLIVCGIMVMHLWPGAARL